MKKKTRKNIKKVVSMLLTFVMVFSIFAVVPMTTASAASGKTIPLNEGLLRSVGSQDWKGYACSCYSLAYCKTILDGRVHHFSEYNQYGNTQYNVNCVWSKGGYVRKSGTSQSNVLKMCYDYVNSNVPVIIHVTSSYGQHWVTVVGYQNVSNPNNMNIKNLVILDPVYGYPPRTNNYSLNSSRNYVVPSGYIQPAPTPTQPPITYSTTTGGSSNVSNTNATISGSANASNGTAPHVNSWGYYIGTNSNPTDKKTVSWPNGNVSSLSCNVKDHCGSLSPGTTYYYKIWAVINGKEYTGGVNSFRTTAVKPSASTIRTSTADIGLGVNPIVTWSSTNYTDSYTVQLKNSNGDVIQSKSDITGTTYSFDGLNTADTYTATIYSVNTVGSTQANSVNITVHPNSTVKFIDVNPETNEEVVIKEQSVVYGANATPPANPTKTGYTFKNWNGNYNNVKADTNITSVYEINVYKAKFVNSYTGELLKTEDVKYKHSATPPEYELPKGYVNVESGWDKDYTCVLDNTTYYSVIDWGNYDIPMYIDSITTKRFTDTSTYDNEGYEVTVNLQNWDKSLTTGRLIVALMTDEGQLLTETESSAFYLKKSAKKAIEVYVPYKEEIDYVRVFVVDQYSTATPISESVLCDNIQTIGSDYSYSYNKAPKPGTYDPDSLTSYTEYRYRTKSTTTSYSTSMSGWTQNGYDLIQSGSGTIDYVPSFPSGFDTNNNYYNLYNKRPVTASETSTSKTTVNTSTVGYLYWHWCRGVNVGGLNRFIWGYPTSNNHGNFYTFHAVFRSSALGNPLYSDGYCYQWQNLSACKDSHWWFGGNQYSTDQTVVQRCSYTNYNKRYNYYRWSAWSDWNTTAKASNSNTEVETRTTYKYIPYSGKPKPIYIDLSSYDNTSDYGVYAWILEANAYEKYFTKAEKDNNTGYYKTSCPIGSSLSFVLTSDGKEPSQNPSNVIEITNTMSFDGINNLYVFKSDSTGLYIDSFSKYEAPRDIEFEKTISGKISSEFAGKQAALFIYKVDSASDYTNEYIGQTVIGKDGSYEFKFKLREEPTIETGDFTVVLNLEGASAPIYLDPIKAPKKEYTVKFYDYDYSNYNPNDPDSKPELKVISEQKVEEGKDAEYPTDKLIGREGYTFSNWSATATNVHSNLEITAEYQINEYTVVFVDWNARNVDIQKFKHGDILVAPQPEEVEEGTLVQWDAIANGETTVTHDMVVCTEYTTRKCKVVVTDFDGTVIEEKTVNYGDYINLPDFSDPKYDSYNLIGWTNEQGSHDHIGADDIKDISTLIQNAIITDNCYLCPVYEFEETVLNPTPSVASGEYTEAQTITLSCETEGAHIYYTLDGSDPKGKNGILYTAPIVVEDTAKLSFYAIAVEMNDSSVINEYYVINPLNSQSEWLTYEELPDEVKANPAEYTVTQETGYSYKSIKQTSSSSEYEQLIEDGWTYITSYESDDSDYLDEPYVDDDLIGLKNKSVDVYGNGYQVSHYKYTLNGVEGVCKDASFAPEGAVGEVEYVKAKTFGSVAGFDEASGNAPYYLYNGEKWYNRKSAQVVVGQQYCYTYQIASLYKWTNYTVEIPSANETRETRTEDVYSYEKMKHYIVNVYGLLNCIDTEIYKINSKLNLPEDVYGFNFEGYYYDGEFTHPIDIDNYEVTECTDVFAKYTPKKYTVTFAFMDGTEIETQEVDYLSAANAPELPDVPNYVFVGWDTDFNQIEDDTIIKAFYVKESEYSKVSLDKESVTIFEGNNTKISPVFDNENITLELEWTSSDNNVAIVDNNGIVTAVSEGTAVITATVKGIPESAKCTVTVMRDSVNKLTLKNDSKLDIDKTTDTLRRIKVDNNSVSQIIHNFTNTDVTITDSEGVILLDSELVGTGSVIYLIDDDKAIDKLVAIMTADVSGDGQITLRDACLISKYIIEDSSVPTDYQIYAMDVNGDGMYNVKDTILVLQYIVGVFEI
ncbi:MAG: chitobiase/beta-hexosaminidase C-terminal domain-containing protein [Acutalibacteraceae bacterium]|nr:chitobiase/beta-hexosaminidase C-terminal domain-containing protein [Acutalibacteraceae bacterium]